MNRSPAHQKWPDHKIVERHLQQRVQVFVAGELIADSSSVIQVDEDGSPARYYFPRSDVNGDKLIRTPKTTVCPFKGTAHYFSVNAGGARFDDVVWTYEDPYEEHAGLQDRLAFWNEQSPAIQIKL